MASHACQHLSEALPRMDGARVAFETMFRPCRVVSTHKTRFMEDSLDLDLVYVTKRIIIHGVCSDPLYEDPRTEVRRLLDKYHMDRYKVYNFASDRAQVSPCGGEHKMDGRTESYPFTDDTGPPLESVVEFCENAKAWLDADEENVVSLHCKAGKGRAGIMAACLMVRMGESAHAAVAKYDETQVSDTRGRTPASQRAWVFLYERLVREVWGLRDSIGTVSGQNPSLRAPPRLATSLREISLEMQMFSSRNKWRPVLYNPSCAVYQQTPAGKAMVHRAKMPAVYTGKKREMSKTFTAALPRSVVVEGTFQVVVSAATGMFGVGKNVLDVWCNTTFLGEDGGREIFNFTANDLPPGALAERLLAAGVRVVITHSHPNTTSPLPKQASVDLDTTTLRAGVSICSNQLNTTGRKKGGQDQPEEQEEIATPETTQGVISDVTAEGDRTIIDGDDNSSGEKVGVARVHVSTSTVPHSENASAGKTPKIGTGSLRITVDEDLVWSSGFRGPWDQAMTRSKSAMDKRSTPLMGVPPSPLRSCPRSSMHGSEACAEGDEVTERLLPRWASSKLWMGRIPHSSSSPKTPAEERTPSFRQTVPSASPRAIARVFERLGKQPRTITPIPPIELRRSCSSSSLLTGDTVGQASDAGDIVGGGDVSAGPFERDEDEAAGPTSRDVMKPWAAGGTVARGPRTDEIKNRRHELTLNTPMFSDEANRNEGEKRGDVEELDNVETATIGTTPSSAGIRKPSPAVRRLLQTASKRSFEDLPSSSQHTVASVYQSEQDTSEEDGARGDIDQLISPESDGENAASAARVLAGWVENKLKPAASDLGDSPTDRESRVIAAVRGSPGSTKYIETEDLTLIPPLKLRGWPPTKPVVAGEMEVLDVLELREGAPQGSGRDWGAAGSSWGEEAKLALARKRLQWEKSRRGVGAGSESLRMHAAMIAKREAEILAIETDVKEAVRILEERIARRESAEAAWIKWKRQLPPEAYEDVMSCLNGIGGFSNNVSKKD